MTDLELTSLTDRELRDLLLITEQTFKHYKSVKEDDKLMRGFLERDCMAFQKLYDQALADLKDISEEQERRRSGQKMKPATAPKHSPSVTIWLPNGKIPDSEGAGGPEHTVPPR